MQVHGAVRLGEHEGAVGVSATYREEPAGEHAVELAREAGQHLQRLAVHRPRRAAQDLRVDVRRRECLGHDDHLGRRARGGRRGSGPRRARGSARPPRARGRAGRRRCGSCRDLLADGDVEWAPARTAWRARARRAPTEARTSRGGSGQSAPGCSEPATRRVERKRSAWRSTSDLELRAHVRDRASQGFRARPLAAPQGHQAALARGGSGARSAAACARVRTGR